MSAALAVAGWNAAAAPADLDAITFQTIVAGGVGGALAVRNAGDGSSRLFVVRQGGIISVVDAGGALLPTPFLDIGSGGSSPPLGFTTGGERGLLGLAFHPQYATNGRFFINYTDGSGSTVVARYTVSSGNANQADPASGSVVLRVYQPYSNHNGGDIHFGPDGYLYIGMGDGGSGNDPGNRAQDPRELLGKVLRIDVDRGTPYGIPPGNAYAGGGGRPEIFASGLRNPWRMSFDRVAGDLYIGDVGQDAQEEIDFLPRGAPSGANFGWRVVEGTRCTGLPNGAQCPSPSFTPPILVYEHGEGCSVTGGVVYRGRAVPALFGRYVYADFCTGRMWSAARDRSGAWQTEVLAETGHQVAAIGEDASGELYWSDLRTGDVHRLAADPSVPVVVEYHSAANGHYFLTAFADEAAYLDGGAFGGAWQRTGHGFAVATPIENGAADACRFFGAPGTGLDTHFYTGDAHECAALQANPRWTYEAVGFRARLPVAGACAQNTRPVWRLYSDPTALAGVNHRFTTDGTVYAAMVARGWLAEGVAFCAR